MKKSSKIALPIILGGTAAVLSAISVKAINEYFYSYAVKRQSEPYVSEYDYDKNQTLQDARKWFASMNAQENVLHAFDEVLLHTLTLKNTNSKKWVVIAHGYQSNYKEELDVAQKFYNEGFNIFMVSLRGHGLSSGKTVGFGWPDRLDVLTCINYLVTLDKEIKIVLYGLSMGASTMMNVTGENLPPQVVCCVEDSGYSSMEKVLKFSIKQLYPKLPKVAHSLIIHNLNRLIKKRCLYSIYENSCINQLKKSKTPTLFIHGEEDDIVPFSMVFDNYYACAAEKELYTVPHAKHGLANLMPQYYERVFLFVHRYL